MSQSRFLVELCEPNGTGPVLLQDPHTWSSREEAWSYWERTSEQYSFVLVSLDDRL